MISPDVGFLCRPLGWFREMSARTTRDSPPTDSSFASGRPLASDRDSSLAYTDPDLVAWVSLDILSQSSIFREHDLSPLADLQTLVGLGQLEEWDLFGEEDV